MTRLFLAAGVATLAISAPAAARPGGGHTGDKQDRQTVTATHAGGAGAQRTQAVERRSAQRQSANVQRGGGAERMHSMQRFAAAEHQRPQAAHVEHQQVRAERMSQGPAHTERAQNRMVEHQQVRTNRAEQARVAERQQVRANRVEPARVAERQDLRANRAIERQDLRANRLAGANQGVGYGVGGCPPGLANKGCMPPGQANKLGLVTNRQALRADRIVNANAFRASRFAALSALTPRTRIIAPVEAVRFVGQPLSAVTPLMALSPLPVTASYLYPDTPNYYYQYGGGYLYQVDRGSNLISALLPLLAGGYMPGQYLPSSYMNSYVPSYYGLNSFYPSSYPSGYGYGYGYGYGNGYDNLCNRYANGVVYQVDCVTGMIVDVVPTYAGGYGVGQMLPSSYGYYNVPSQYRSMYFNTPDNNYWYAPGAIYQYDPSSSLITSVAALLSPGFAVGQQLPMGYSAYNVPYAYRSTYYDTPNAWYRYNNGYIYQVDPTTQIVSAMIASVLT